MKAINIKRLIPKGWPNPNIGKSYANMEEKLEEYFKSFSYVVPIIMRTGDKYKIENEQEFFTINPKDVIGYATNFLDDYMVVQIDEEHYPLIKSLENPRVEIASVIDTNYKDKIVIDKVIKLMITEED